MKQSIAADQLKSIISRIENLSDEKQTIADHIKDVFAEAKSNGFDVKGLKALIKLRKLDAQEREEQEQILQTYLAACGMIPEFEAA